MEFYTTKDVASLLKVTPLTVRRWLLSGKLGSYRVGQEHRISNQQLQDFLQSIEIKPKTEHVV